MSTIIEKETRQVNKTVKIFKCLKCDICGKEFTGPYWIANTHHDDWGNDSVDSYENFDLCSEKCVEVMFQKYMKDCKHSDTHYLSLEQDVFEEHVKEYLEE